MRTKYFSVALQMHILGHCNPCKLNDGGIRDTVGVVAIFLRFVSLNADDAVI